MKISQEVRDFARLNPPPAHPEGGLSLSKARLEGGEQDAEADLSAEATAKAEAGMAQMSKRFHDEGGEIYVKGGGVETGQELNRRQSVP